MSLIKKIYNDINFESVDAVALHKLEMQVYELAQNYEQKNKNKRIDLNQLLIEASTYGHETGFIIGFRYAVKLLSECYL